VSFHLWKLAKISASAQDSHSMMLALKTRTIAFFAENNTHTSTAYFHVYVFRKPLQDLGLDLKIYPILPNFLFPLWIRIRSESKMTGRVCRKFFTAFVIPVYRMFQIFGATLGGASAYGMGRFLIQMHTPPRLEQFIGWLARKRRVPFILFYPDALHLLCPDLYATRFRAASHVISVTPWLSETVSQMGYLSSCVRASINTERYPLCNQSKSPVTIGFSGGPGNAEALRSLEPVLTEVLARRPGVRLKIVGKAPPPFKSALKFEFLRWSNDDPFSTPYEPGVEEMLDFQIGLAPIVEDEYALGKDSVKLRQYMALGLAVVGSDYGVNQEVIRHGENGLLARNQQGWVDAILELVDNAETREKLGTRARADVESLFSAKVQAQHLAAQIEQAIKTSQDL
jgi:glycosyltransferase involved in cell wall biosynthesis